MGSSSIPMAACYGFDVIANIMNFNRTLELSNKLQSSCTGPGISSRNEMLETQNICAAASVCLSMLVLGCYLFNRPLTHVNQVAGFQRFAEISWTVCGCVNAEFNQDLLERKDHIVLVATIVKLLAEWVILKQPEGLSRRLSVVSFIAVNALRGFPLELDFSVDQIDPQLPSEATDVPLPKDIDQIDPQLPAEATDVPLPKDIVAELNKVVIGQKDAKQKLAVQAYQHLRNSGRLDYQPTNTLMQGPSGSGKTLLIQTLAKILGVPFVIVDATSYSSTGLVGNNASSMFSQLLIAANGDIKLAEKGFIFIDEIDKLAKRDWNAGQEIQQEMLTFLEGRNVSIPTGPHSKTLMNTSGIMFFAGGAFTGLQVSENIDTQALINYGLTPEFLGRFALKTTLQPLDEDMLVQVLKESEGSILKKKKVDFEREGITLTFTDEAIEVLARRALSEPTGVRALNSNVENLLIPIMSQYFGEDNKGVYIQIKVEEGKLKSVIAV